MKNTFVHTETMYKVNTANYSKLFHWPMNSFHYKITTVFTHFTITSAQHVYAFLTLVVRSFVINNEKKFQFLFQQCNIYIYIFYFNNNYSIITPICFDTFVSSSGSSKVIHR